MKTSKTKQHKALVEEPVECVQTMQKLTMEPGKHYEGSAWINEFGELHFRPRQKGKNPQGLKKVSEGENHVLYTSKNWVRVVFTLPRYTPAEIVSLFREAATQAMADLQTYDLRKI